MQRFTAEDSECVHSGACDFSVQSSDLLEPYLAVEGLNRGLWELGMSTIHGIQRLPCL